MLNYVCTALFSYGKMFLIRSEKHYCEFRLKYCALFRTFAFSPIFIFKPKKSLNLSPYYHKYFKINK